jgi:hypothetical protein
VFYAGHGQIDASNTGSWVASDGVLDPMSQNGWIPNANLRNMIGRLKAQRILVLADSCFSGDFLDRTRGAPPKIDSAYFQKAVQLRARQVLTAGSSESVADKSEFGRELVDFLERNTAPFLDPDTMYVNIRLGIKNSLPLLGTLDDQLRPFPEGRWPGAQGRARAC